MSGGPLNPKYAPIYVEAGRKFGIPPNVLAGVADVETNGGANISTSSTGAQGLMQFEPGTAHAMGVNPYDARSAIFGAARLLIQYGYRHDPMRALGAYNGGPGNPQYGYARDVMAQARRLSGALARFGGGRAQQGGGRPVRSGGNSGFLGNQTSTTFTGGQPDFNAAGAQALMAAADRPINTSGKFTAGHLLSNFANNIASGQYTTPNQANTKQTSTAYNVLGQPQNRGIRMKIQPGAGDVNPLGHGWTLGRTDMGVDANAAPGTPIVAINDSKVVRILPGWYAGQPLVLMQITAGPNRGKYWYVAEQISGLPRIGQHIARGQVVARYNSHGTGIEIGWGTASGRTLAQATTGYSEGQATRAGLDFRHRELRA